MSPEGDVLIVEDDLRIVDVLEIALRREGIPRMTVARTGAQAIDAVRTSRPSLVVLDVGLPDIDGFDVASRIRGMIADIPLLFLTARDASADKLAAFSLGADDYVTKPFNPLEVAARVKAILRRVNATAQPAVEYDFGRFVLYPDSARLVVDGVEVPTPARELRVLEFLARHEGRVFSAEDVYRSVWMAEPIGPSDQNTVSVHVRRLRERIEVDPAKPQFLLTVRGMGYKLARPHGA